MHEVDKPNRDRAVAEASYKQHLVNVARELHYLGIDYEKPDQLALLSPEEVLDYIREFQKKSADTEQR